MSSKIKALFAKEMAGEESEINLAYAAMLFSEYLTANFDIAAYLKKLDDMSETLRDAVLAAKSDKEKVGVLNRYFFEALQFRGNDLDYYHPDNSFLNRVLDERTGIPISLSVIYLEVGWRLGLPVWGGALPGHFIVGYGRSGRVLYIDVFNGGELLSEDDCLKLARIPLSNHSTFKERYLKPAGKKAILYRMLLNLKQIYITAENWQAAYDTVDLMRIVQPDQVTELRDRGLLAFRLDHLQAAIFDLERYLYLAPENSDAEWIDRQLEMIEQKLLRLN